MKPVINIWSGSRDILGAALTFPTQLSYKKGNIPIPLPLLYQSKEWKDTPTLYQDAETVYKIWKAKCKDWDEIEALYTDIAVEKFGQYPFLFNQIIEKGGDAWLKQCSHQVVNNDRWEGKGTNSRFIRCLLKAFSEAPFRFHDKWWTDKLKFTPEKITTLKRNQIFVFGSNTEGRHGKGAAKLATLFGAQYGVSKGFCGGQTYGIVTKDLSKGIRSIPIEDIKSQVWDLVKTAVHNPDKQFICSTFGCGLAGYKPSELAPMFYRIPQNLILPKCFIDNLPF